MYYAKSIGKLQESACASSPVLICNGSNVQYLDIGVAPWQETECRRLSAEYGPGRFAGLNLFGITCKAAA